MLNYKWTLFVCSVNNLHQELLMSLRPYATFFLTSVSIVGALILAFTKDVDITMLLPTLLGIYVSGKATERVSAHYNARSDPNADTAEVIKSVSDS